MNKRNRKKLFKKFKVVFKDATATPCYSSFLFNITDSGQNVVEYKDRQYRKPSLEEWKQKS